MWTQTVEILFGERAGHRMAPLAAVRPVTHELAPNALAGQAGPLICWQRRLAVSVSAFDRTNHLSGHCASCLGRVWPWPFMNVSGSGNGGN
jgi:hypothetical protein